MMYLSLHEQVTSFKKKKGEKGTSLPLSLSLFLSPSFQKSIQTQAEKVEVTRFEKNKGRKGTSLCISPPLSLSKINSNAAEEKSIYACVFLSASLCLSASSFSTSFLKNQF